MTSIGVSWRGAAVALEDESRDPAVTDDEEEDERSVVLGTENEVGEMILL